MRLWTIQPPEILALLAEKGVCHGTRDHAEFPEAYEWLMSQMKKQLLGYSGKWPVWAWAEKPDLRWYRWHWGEAGWMHCIEFEAAKGTYLLSGYEAWHSVLNQCPYHTEAEFDKWKGWHPKEAWAAEKKRTWPRIFDLKFWRQDPEWFGSDPSIQATVDGLRLEQVIAIRTVFCKSPRGP